jgi:hypothetical protein
VALLAAFVSWLLALIIQMFTSWNRSRRDYGFLTKALDHEVQTIKRVAEERGGAPQVDVFILPDLPTDAWDAWRMSQHRWRFSEGEQAAMESLYGHVAYANAKSRAVPAFLQVAAISPDEEARDAFRTEAGRLSSEPMGAITGAAPAALTTIQDARTWRRRMLLP